jgi:hypothetical protein
VEPKHLLPGAALLSLVSGSAAAVTIGAFTPSASTMTPSPAGSTGLNPLGPAVGGMDGGPVTFTAPFAGTLIMQVQDFPGAPGGDVFQAFVDGASLGFTTPVPINPPTDPPGGTQLSSGTFTTPVPAGPNNFDINDQILSYIGFSSPYGGGIVPASYTPAGFLVTLSEEPFEAVPEPGVFALLASWLLGLGLIGRLRQKAKRA